MQIKFSKKIKKVLSGFLISALIVFLILVFGSTQSSFLPESLEESIIGKTQRNGAEALENIFYDLFFKASTHSARADEEDYNTHQRVSISDSLDQNIYIVDIDEPSLTKLGNYNEWDRSIHAKVIQNLSEGGAAAISFDILFKSADFGKQKTDQAASVLKKIAPEAKVDSLYPSLLANYNFDSMLVNSVKESGNAIVCYMFDDRKSYKHPSQWIPLSTLERADAIGYSSTLDTTQIDKIENVEPKDLLDNIFPELAQAGAKFGSVNAYPDNDGVVRKVSMLYRFPNPTLDIISLLDTTIESDKQIYEAIISGGDKNYVYSTMSLMTILHLFHKDPKDITVKMGKYIDVGKPFGIYRDSAGTYHTTYPNFSYHMFLLLRETLAEKKIQSKASEGILEISHKVFASKNANGKITLELSNGGSSSIFDENQSKLLTMVSLDMLDALEEQESVKLNRDYIIRKDEDEDGFYQIVRKPVDTSNSEDEEEEEDEDDQESIDFTRSAIKTLDFYKDTLKRMPVGQKMILSLDMQIHYNKAIKKWNSNQAILSDAVIRDIQATSEEAIKNLKPGEELRFGKVKRIPIDQAGRYQVKYKGRYNEINNRRFQHLSYYDVYKGRVDNLFYQGKIFILGSAAAALFDFVPGPHEENYPAVLIHATIIKNILADDYLVTLSEKKQEIIVIMLALLCLVLGLYFTSSISVALSLILMTIYTFIAYKYFQGGLYIGVSKQLLAMLLTSITALVVQFYFENKEKNFINNAFKQYISPELITAMVENEIMPTLGGEKSYITAYFTDIASFSTFSEKIGDPSKLVDLLNEYLTAMTDTLLENKGTLDKYEGDAIIAFFGAPMPLPNHAQSACETAVEMQRKLIALRKKWITEDDKWPTVVHNMHMRIGINSGDIVTGNMGSSMRKNYTMMGDAVNLAARLESAAKQYGAYIQISEDTQKDLVKGDFIYRSLDTIRVIGKSQPVKTYEILEKADCKYQESLKELVGIWEKARACYLNMQWDDAIELFKQCLELEPHHPDRDPGSKTTPSHVYIKRCEAYKITPPVAEGEVWDGVFTATEK